MLRTDSTVAMCWLAVNTIPGRQVEAVSVIVSVSIDCDCVEVSNVAVCGVLQHIIVFNSLALNALEPCLRL